MAKRREVSVTDVGDNLPLNMKEMLANIPLITPDDDEMGSNQENYDWGLNARCMTCGGELEGATTLILNGAGMIAIHCSGICSMDMQVIGWLEETYEEIAQKVRFRGNPEADEGDDEESE